MKTAIKIITVLFVLVVALIIGLVVLGLGQIDKFAKAAVEYGGEYAMGVETTVDSMDVAVKTGAVEMTGLNIANPQGFDTSHFFQLASASAEVDKDTLFKDAIIIPTVVLRGIDVTLDKGNNPSNYNQILENLSRFESGEGAPADASKEGKNVIIKSLILEDINIHLANMPGISLLAGDVAINIPQIELKNIGEQESMNAGDIFGLVVKTVMAAAVESGGGIIPSDVLGELGNGLSGLTSLSDLGIDAISDLDLDGALGQVGEQIDQATQDVQDAVDNAVNDAQDKVDNVIDDATNDLKSIFGGKKKDD